MIRFTVVTVTYNAAATIAPTLASVERQTHPYIEHLIIDGCSQDATLTEVRRYAERAGSREGRSIVLVREPDSGLYDAMNKGLAQARGDYLFFLNAGDCLHADDTLAAVAEQLDNYPRQRRPAVAYGETDIVDADGRFLRHRRLEAPDVLTADSFLSGMLVCHQSFYVRTDMARTERYDLAYRYSADFDWCVRILRRASRRGIPVHHTHLVLTDYLAEGITTRNHTRSLLERARIMAHHYGWQRTLMAHAWFVVRAVIHR